MTRVVDTHRTVFSADPVGVWSAPGRVNLIGEHTDYNDGLVLPIALPHRTDAACSPRTDDLLRVWSVQTDELVEVAIDDVGPGTPGGWAAYVAGVLWALRADGHEVSGLDVTVDSDVPVGAGLSSSAALECSVGAAASDLFGLGLLADDAGRARLAAACVHAENDVAGAPTGGMDQSAALLCRADHALLLDCRSGATEHVPFDLAGDGTAPGHVLLVTDTRAEHALNDGQYAERRSSCEQAAAELGVTSLRDVAPGALDEALARLSDDVLRRRARHVVTEIARVRAAVDALRAGDLTEVGRLFDASHASLRDDYEVSCAELDASVEAARAAGALGARMTGGGFGGSSIALLPEDRVDDAERAITAAFAERGWGEPRCFMVTAGTSAHRNP
ncbi:MAG TPA: galactokinase [Ornithinibacter sp.]|nr:galactokinase [Ornithinibacter sp.]